MNLSKDFANFFLFFGREKTCPRFETLLLIFKELSGSFWAGTEITEVFYIIDEFIETFANVSGDLGKKNMFQLYEIWKLYN